MPDVTVNIEIYCDRCGAGICHNATFVTTRHRSEPSFRIEPCEKCLSEARDEGYEDGYKAASEELAEAE